MGWEYRARGGPYYIRRQMVNGREVRQCLKGPEAERAATEDAERQAEREAHRAERKHLEMLDAQGSEADEMVNILMKASLMMAGFNQHHRSEWRKGRHG